MKRNFLFFFVLPIILFAISFLIFFLFNKFQIRTVIVSSEDLDIYGLEKLNNQNLLLLDVDKFTKSLVRQNSLISSASGRKEYPDRLIIYLYKREPIALVASSPIKYYIDKEGILLPKVKDIDLPQIEVSNIQVFLGQQADWRITKAVNLLQNMSKQSILVDRIIIDDRESLFRMHLKGDVLVLVPYNFEGLILAPSLQIIMSRFRIEGKFIRKIDFRFDKPTVVLSNGEEISSPL